MIASYILATRQAGYEVHFELGLEHDGSQWNVLALSGGKAQKQ